MLDTLQLPQDLKSLSQHDLETLAAEIRQKLLQIGEACGGHLASNLGVVELTLALHAVLDSPHDRFVWDTSHQCYVHKMLTGRLEKMFTIRQWGGLSGFAKIAESEHDQFGAGHASTALSAALGMAHARDLQGQNNTVVAIIGDASLSGGMAFEALNNSGKIKSNFICILNDNDMSISRPIGNMADYMTRLRTSHGYNAAKEKFERVLDRIPKIGAPLRHRIERVVERFRDMVIDVKFGVLFEEFGYRYLGPIDGHNIPLLMAAIRYAKSYQGPIMLHIHTVKGKGHQPAEADPISYHGVAPKKKSPPPPTPAKTYTQVFGEEVMALAKENPSVVVITPAMKEGSGLVEYAATYPDRFFDVGIAEEHAVTFAAGLARAGIRPILSIYSTFLQRGFDQVIHDVCLQHLPVVFCLDRSGIVGEDGPTHHGVFDFSYLLPIPHLSILAPKDGDELRAMMQWAVLQPEAVSIRFPKGSAQGCEQYAFSSPIVSGKAEIVADFSKGASETDLTFIAVGAMVETAVQVAQDLFSKDGLTSTVINLRFLKPLDTDLLQTQIASAKHVFVLEEGAAIGGVFGYLLESLSLSKNLDQFTHIAIPDRFLDHGKIDQIKHDIGLTQDKILTLVREKCLLPSFDCR